MFDLIITGGVATSEEARLELVIAGADAIVRTCGDELVNAIWA